MSLSFVLKRWLTQTGYYATIDSVSNSGDPVYGTPTTFTCRVEYNVWKVGPKFIPRTGEDGESSNVIFTEADIPLDAMVWFPGEDETDTAQGQRPKRREDIRDNFGAISHYEMYF